MYEALLPLLVREADAEVPEAEVSEALVSEERLEAEVRTLLALDKAASDQ